MYVNVNYDVIEGSVVRLRRAGDDQAEVAADR